MSRIKSIAAGLILAASTAIVTTAPAADKESAGVKVGVLNCRVDGGWGFVFGSSKDVRCNYSPYKGKADRYYGSIDKYGVDIGYTEGSVMVWAVFAPTTEIDSGALEGNYGGASASAAVGVGAGANILVGGFDKSITLQPISVEGQTGLNIAAGISGITLKSVPKGS